jgi:NADH dehydrogenase/NADH:ubiquinone oxidoreductase subunit G
MDDSVTLTIDTRSVTVPAGSTILSAAQLLGIQIPTICYHEACTSNGLCRTCMVEVQGSRLLAAACVAQVNQGMVVSTQSPRIDRARRTILEMLASAVDLSEAPEIQDMLQEAKANEDRFPLAIRLDIPRIDDNPMYVRDYSKCILCWRCIQVCASDAQYAYAINFSGRGFETQISTFFEQPLPTTTCVFCGQCVGVCPTNALKPKREAQLEQGLNPDEILQTSRSERRRRSR